MARTACLCGGFSRWGFQGSGSGLGVPATYKGWSQKTRILQLAVGENCMILGSLVLSQYQHVTDRQTNMLPKRVSCYSTAEHDKITINGWSVITRVTTLQTKWNSPTIPWRFVALLPMLSVIHIMPVQVLLSVVGVGMPHCMILNQNEMHKFSKVKNGRNLRHFYSITLLIYIVRRPCCVSALTSP